MLPESIHHHAPRDTPPRLLLAEDYGPLRQSYARVLTHKGFDVQCAGTGLEAVELLAAGEFDAILSDIDMPGLNGLELLRRVRSKDADLPVILMTGGPELSGAMDAIKYGAIRYLAKPLQLPDVLEALREAVQLRRLARLKQEALRIVSHNGFGDPRALDTALTGALETMWMAYQPIVDWPNRKVTAYEALLRTREATLANPVRFIEAAQHLDRLPELGRAVRNRVAQQANEAPSNVLLFVNLHSADLLDEHLYDAGSPLSKYATRVVLELTEREALDNVPEVPERVKRLRALGFRIAVDDLGSGYAGLNTFALLQPEVVKLDMSLVRDVDTVPTKAKLVGAMTHTCHELGIHVVVEGVETAGERAALEPLQPDSMQGYLFARPREGFAPVEF